MDGVETSAARFIGTIHDRIGPIADSAFLNILSQEQVKNIAVTIAKAELNTVNAQAKALQDIIGIMEATNVQAKST